MITLTSDFGTPYPAAMKGVILRRCDARLVDIAHDLPRQDVRAAAFWLRFVLPEFPPAVHLAVVDPGVGTDRPALAVRAGAHVLVGPDNGALMPVARRLAGAGERPDEAGRTGHGGEDDVAVFTLDYDDPDSATFHGRDVFAPAAATVHEAVAERSPPDRRAWSADDVGAVESLPRVSPADDYVDLTFPNPTVGETSVKGEVLVVDDFGNVVTNVPGRVIEGRRSVRVNGERVPVGPSFAAVDPGERIATVGSHGYVECDVNRGRGDEAFGLGPDDEVRLRFD